MYHTFAQAMKTKLLSICSIFLLLLLFLGCGPARPEGLPELHPCTITVVDGSKPMSGISVSFLRHGGQGAWSLGGLTNSSGILQARTVFGSYEGRGVPAGTYAVVLNEKFNFPVELDLTVDQMLSLSPEESAKHTQKRDEFIAANRTLPPSVCDPDNSPLELTVDESGGTLVIDLSKYR